MLARFSLVCKDTQNNVFGQNGALRLCAHFKLNNRITRK